VAIGFYELTGPLTPLKASEKGVNETYRSQAGVIVKLNNPGETHAVANEYVSAELAKHIRLPLPPHFVATVKRTEEPAFCSLNATMRGGALPPIDAKTACQNEPDLCTGVILFDIWIANDDRSRKNVAYLENRPPHRLIIFDHSHAPFFYPDFDHRNRLVLGINRQSDGRRHCLLDHLATDHYFDKWVNRIANLSNEYIKEILDDAGELGLKPEHRFLGYDFLCGRRDRLPKLLRNHRNHFTGIQNWGLLWGT
jgi:hypothetical protein